ncbi:MAG: ABC transporter permease subunit [Nitriliruptorales bacterium]|nr:ABC transporter permease subunit [Nitriliruptorales bacterium]
MTPARTFATTHRVLRQLAADPRSVMLLLAVPALLLWLLDIVYRQRPASFQAVGIPIFAIAPFIGMFLVTSVTVLRERRSGTLERLLTTPLGKADLLLGYQLAFGLVAIAQVLVLTLLALGPLDLTFAGPPWMVGVVGVLDALLGSALGLFASAFAASEFQAVQFLPALVFPQLILGGVLAPTDELPRALQYVSDLLPLTYALEAVRTVATETAVDSGLWADVGVVAGTVVLAVALGAATLRRRTA